MDTLPSLLLTKILSYHSGKDISRFHQLNSKLREFIKRHRNYLRCPVICLEFFHHKDDPEQEIDINLHFKYEKLNGNVLYSRWPDYLSKKRFQAKNYFKFFKHFFDREPECQLRQMLDYMFEKVDIEELSVAHLHDEEWFEDLSEALKASSCRIHSVLASPYAVDVPEVEVLLRTIANRKNVSPLLRIGSFESFLKDTPNVYKINEIASMFRSARVEQFFHTGGMFMSEIAEQWKRERINKFHFYLHIHVCKFDNNSKYMLDFIEEKGFDVSYVNQNYFVDSYPDDLPSSIRFTDLDTGNAVQFDRKEEVLLNRKYIWSADEMNAVHISITLVLE